MRVWVIVGLLIAASAAEAAGKPVCTLEKHCKLTFVVGDKARSFTTPEVFPTEAMIDMRVTVNSREALVRGIPEGAFALWYRGPVVVRTRLPSDRGPIRVRAANAAARKVLVRVEYWSIAKDAPGEIG